MLKIFNFHLILACILLLTTSCQQILQKKIANSNQKSTDNRTGSKDLQKKTPFADALKVEYMKLSEQEWQAGNKSLAKFYSAKSLNAGNGESVLPTATEILGLPNDRAEELFLERRFILNNLNNNIATRYPTDMAKLQVMFDCYVKQEAHKKQSALNCHNEYYKAKEKISGDTIDRIKIKPIFITDPETKELKPINPQDPMINNWLDNTPSKNKKGKAEAKITLVDNYKIYFLANKLITEESSKKELEALALKLKLRNPKEVKIFCHAAKNEKNEFSKKLAEKRIISLSNYLIKIANLSPKIFKDLRAYGPNLSPKTTKNPANDIPYCEIKI